MFESAARQLAALGKIKAAARISQEGPPFPDPLEYLWVWYLQHCMGLASGGMSHPVITWEGLYAWSRITGIELEAWEADVLMNLSCIKANLHAESMLEKAKK